MTEPGSSGSVDLDELILRAHVNGPPGQMVATVPWSDWAWLLDMHRRLQAQVADLREQYGLYVHGAETEARQLRADLEIARSENAELKAIGKGFALTDSQFRDRALNVLIRVVGEGDRNVASLRADLEHTRQIVAADRQAFADIKEHYGKVCPEFEVCTHPWCESSVGAWMIADAALVRLDAADVPAASTGEPRLIATGPYDGSACHPIHGRHYHCANCDEVSSYQGHMAGNPPAFSCSSPAPSSPTEAP